MPVWEGFLDRLEGGRHVFARIDVGYTVGDVIEFVALDDQAKETGRRKLAKIVRKEPCKPTGWVILTVET